MQLHTATWLLKIYRANHANMSIKYQAQVLSPNDVQESLPTKHIVQTFLQIFYLDHSRYLYDLALGFDREYVDWTS